MKIRSAWLALALTGTAMSQQQPALPPARPAGPVEVNGIAATVNRYVITKSELGFALAPIYAQLAAQFPRRGAEFERQVLDAREKILQALIDEKIVLSAFADLKAKGANLPESVVQEERRRQIREKYNGDENLLHQDLKRANLSEDKYNDMVRNQLIVQAMRAEHSAEAPPPLPSEIEKEYAEIKDQIRDTTKDRITFSKIFIPRIDPANSDSTQEQQLDLAEKLATDVRNGQDIGELAKKFSKDAYAEEGGLQKDLPREDLAREFAAIIFAGKDGEILGPLEDLQGYTIVKIIHIEKGPAPALDGEVRKRVEDMVRRKKTSVGYERWIAEQRKSAMISRKL